MTPGEVAFVYGVGFVAFVFLVMLWIALRYRLS